MTVTEAGSAAEVVVEVNIEMSRLTPVTPLALNILLTLTVTSLCATAGSVPQATLHHTVAGFTSRTGGVWEVPVVGLAPVTLVSSHAGLTLTLPVIGALEVE